MEIKPISTDYWHACIFAGIDLSEIEDQMLGALKSEVPEMCSVALERACNLQCRHCIYPADRSSEAVSRAALLPELVRRAVSQLPGSEPRLLHEGRVIKSWHIEVLAGACQARDGLRIGLIDNGTYVRLIGELAASGLRLDWLDISIDGPEAVHNAQRRSSTAFRTAIDGLRRAKEITVPGGRVSSLFTLTALNHASLEETAEILLGGESLIDQLHVTTVSPVRRELEPLEQHDLTTFWRQAQRVYERYGLGDDRKQRVFFRFYRLEEIAKLARVVGSSVVRRGFIENVGFASGEVYAEIGGIPIVYAPLSLWPSETFLIDADGACRTAYSIGYSLADLKRGCTGDGTDVSGYTVAQLTPGFDLRKTYERCVDQWWNFRGRESFVKERALLQSL